jgi:hypothetical protein
MNIVMKLWSTSIDTLMMNIINITSSLSYWLRLIAIGTGTGN